MYIVRSNPSSETLQKTRSSVLKLFKLSLSPYQQDHLRTIKKYSLNNLVYRPHHHFNKQKQKVNLKSNTDAENILEQHSHCKRFNVLSRLLSTSYEYNGSYQSLQGCFDDSSDSSTRTQHYLRKKHTQESDQSYVWPLKIIPYERRE